MISGRVRRLGFGLATILGLARRGFFIPYRYAASISEAAGHDRYGAVAEVLAGYEQAFRSALTAMEALAEDLQAIGGGSPSAPRWNQDWFPRLDAAMAYTLVRHNRPRRIVEIGSGHSTRFLARAVLDGHLETVITAIDPAPRAALSGLFRNAGGPIDLIRAKLQDVDADHFSGLEAGDMVSMDSSHILMPGTDVDHMINQVLPNLPAGVLMHFHDIFLPDDYPADWAWRGYNEQLGVAGLLFGDFFEPLFASHYVATRLAATVASGVAGRLPLAAGAHESSLWLRKK